MPRNYRRQPYRLSKKRKRSSNTIGQIVCYAIITLFVGGGIFYYVLNETETSPKKDKQLKQAPVTKSIPKKTKQIESSPIVKVLEKEIESPKESVATNNKKSERYIKAQLEANKAIKSIITDLLLGAPPKTLLLKINSYEHNQNYKLAYDSFLPLVNLLKEIEKQNSGENTLNGQEVSGIYGVIINALKNSDYSNFEADLDQYNAHPLFQPLIESIPEVRIKQKNILASINLVILQNSILQKEYDKLLTPDEFLTRVYALDIGKIDCKKKINDINKFDNEFSETETGGKYNRLLMETSEYFSAILKQYQLSQAFGDGVVTEENENEILAVVDDEVETNKRTKIGFYRPEYVFIDPSSQSPILVKLLNEGTGDIKQQSDNVVFSSKDKNDNFNAQKSTIKIDSKIENELFLGPLLSCSENNYDECLYNTDFKGSFALGTGWESVPGAIKVNSKKGYITLNRYSEDIAKVKDGNRGDMRIKLISHTKTSRVAYSFDVAFRRCDGFMVDLCKDTYGRKSIGISFALGKDKKKKSGIYISEKLIAKHKNTKRNRFYHIEIIRDSEEVSLLIDGKKISASIPTEIANEEFFVFNIFCQGELRIKRFSIYSLLDKQQKDDRDNVEKYPYIIGKSLIGNKILFKSNNSNKFQNVNTGHPILICQKNNTSNNIEYVHAKILDTIDDYFVVEPNENKKVSTEAIALLDEKKTFGIDEFDHTVAQCKKTHEKFIRVLNTNDNESMAFVNDIDASDSDKDKNSETSSTVKALGDIINTDKILFASILEKNMDELTLDIDGNTFRRSSCYLVDTEKLRHPCCKVPNGFYINKSIKVECENSGKNFIIKGTPEFINKYTKNDMVILSANKIDDFCMLDTGSWQINETKYSAKEFAKDWNIINGQWKYDKGRMKCSLPTDKCGPSMVVLKKLYSGNVEFNFNICVEEPAQQTFCQFVKDISIMVYDPESKGGITFGLGAEGFGGVSVDKGTISGGHSQVENKFREYNKIKEKERQWKGHGTFVWGEMEAKIGKAYNLRLQKIGNTYAFYANGKRLIFENHQEIKDNFQFWIIAPESSLSIGKFSVKTLDKNYSIPNEEPPLGQFGYVLKADDKKMVVDSSGMSLEKGTKVSVVEIEKVVRSEKTQDIVYIKLKRVAKCRISDIEPNLTLANITQTDSPILTGMKVLPGWCDKEFIITAGQIANIDYEF